MKHKLITLSHLLVFCLTHVAAHANAEPKILAESKRFVGFAPPEYAGEYRFQILEDGNVLSIDNKNNVKPLAVLETEIIEQLKKNIAKIPENLKLVRPTGRPECMDAPSYSTLVHNARARTILIAQTYNCIASLNPNADAEALALWIEQLRSKLMDQPASGPVASNQLHLMPTALMGQEGYGAPAEPAPQPSPIKTAPEKTCTSSSNTESGAVYSVELFKTSSSQSHYTLVVRKTVQGQQTENSYRVAETTDYRLLGSPQTFDGKNVHFAVQYTTTPRPDGLHPGTLLLLPASARHSPVEIPLLCK